MSFVYQSTIGACEMPVFTDEKRLLNRVIRELPNEQEFSVRLNAAWKRKLVTLAVDDDCVCSAIVRLAARSSAEYCFSIRHSTYREGRLIGAVVCLSFIEDRAKKGEQCQWWYAKRFYCQMWCRLPMTITV